MPEGLHLEILAAGNMPGGNGSFPLNSNGDPLPSYFAFDRQDSLRAAGVGALRSRA